MITVPEKPFVYARRLGQETVVVQGEDDFATSNMDQGKLCCHFILIEYNIPKIV